MVSQSVAVAGAVLLATVFVAAAVAKGRDRAGFAASLRALAVVPPRLVPPLAWLVPLAEAAAALAMLVTLVTASAFLAWTAALTSLALLAGFGVVIVRALSRRSTARCACFGPRGAAFAPRHLVRNAGLALAALAVGATAAPAATVAPHTVLAAAVGLVLAVLVVALDDLAELFGPGGRPRPQSGARGWR